MIKYNELRIYYGIPYGTNHFEMAHSSLSTVSSLLRPINPSQYFDVYCGMQFYGIRHFHPPRNHSAYSFSCLRLYLSDSAILILLAKLNTNYKLFHKHQYFWQTISHWFTLHFIALLKSTIILRVAMIL